MTTPTFAPTPGRPPWVRFVKLGVLVLLFVLAGVAGSLSALYLFEQVDIPDVAQLSEHQPNIITRIYDERATLVGEFAEERRIVVDYRQFPQSLVNAVIAVEDADFFSHHGLNVRGIARAAVVNARERRVVEGGSSLTQQLAKLMFLTPERSLERKVKEAILALHIERNYSKEEILAFYLNQVYLGHNRYGVESAAKFFFGKHVGELTLDEAALLAGLPQRPNAYSPYRNPEEAKQRRDHVLERMWQTGLVPRSEAEAAIGRPIRVVELVADTNDEAPYFIEQVRQRLERSFGGERLYRDGLNVYTTLDRELQKTAEAALRSGLLDLDKRQGWRRERPNALVTNPGSSLSDYRHPDWERPPRTGDLVHGLVTSVRANEATVRVDQLNARIDDAPRWTRRSRVGDLFRPGDIELFRVTGVDPSSQTIGLIVEQEPLVEGAVVVLDVKTGRIRALVGGWDFNRSRFDRAVQALRQTGSAFKPILFSSALDNGFTAADIILDEPLAIADPSTGKVYSPENYSQNYYGLTTVREALEKSRNPVSVQLLQRVGAETVIRTARRLGLTSTLEPYPSLALGVFEVTLLEMTSAYATFANQGLLSEPFLIERIEDRNGLVVMERHPVARPAISPEIAYLTTSLMQGVIQSGTARSAKSLGGSLAGKTGTTDDFTDAWFLGYSPSVAIGVWVGFDRKRNLGRGEVGAVAALPIWTAIMEKANLGHEGEDFVKPNGIEFVTIDKQTGLLASDVCTQRFREAFLRGTAPVTFCSERQHRLHSLPYALQKAYLAGGEVPGLSHFADPPTTAVDTEP